MKNSILKRRLNRLSGTVGTVLLLGAVCTSCSDDLLTGTPSWLGESIYQELENRGTFTETLKLINAQSEDYASVLSKTGSKTLFVADDAAWKEFYKNNPWGVTSIDQMSEAQKKLLFKANMISSAYLVELLGNIPSKTATSDPIEGSCMRRASEVNVMDSVPVVEADKFPTINPVRLDSKTGEQVDYWSRVRGKESILLLQDDEVASMIHFMPKFMQVNNITSEDVEFMTNGEIKSNEGAFVNGKVITEKDITCQNGYIHVLEGVAMPLDNMANVIASDNDFSIYNRLLDRFSYPSYSQAMTEEYQRQFGGEDSVYVKRYFNSHGSHKFTARDANDGGLTVSTQLPFDPGWNRYSVYNQSGTTYQYDAAVMLVPTDAAMMKYLEEDGSDINERYATAGPGATAWDNAPDEVVLPLLQNTMLSNLKSSIPSQFGNISNTAGEYMGVEKSDVEKVLWACNGVVYKTNKVYVAPEYVSVYYPCVIRANDDLRLVYTVVNNDNRTSGGEGFYAYLNNMGSDYSFIIPTDNALQRYYDPVSRFRTTTKGASTAVAYQYYVNDAGYIAATAPLVDWETLDANGRGQITSTNHTTAPTTSTNSTGDVFNHFKDIINSSLAVSLFTPGQKFYTAKNGGPIVVEWSGNTVTGIAGSFQYERNYYIPVTETYDKSEEGNGRSYIIDEEPLMSTFTSPYAAINSEDNAPYFSVFASLLDGMPDIKNNDGSGHATQDMAITSMNNYNYTIYIPTNESVQALIDDHKLPTWEDIDAIQNCLEDDKTWEDTDEDLADMEFLEEQATTMKDVISNFVTYHIQDNSVYVEGVDIAHSPYESACLDTTTNRFVKLYVDYSLGGKMTVTDNCGNVRTVSDNKDLHNILTRQYYFNGANLSGDACTSIYSSSFAVLHQIDAPLVPSKTCYYDEKVYNKVQEILAKHPLNGGEPDPTPSGVKSHKTIKRSQR